MGEPFDLYKAPQFVDFETNYIENDMNDSADSYFDAYYENSERGDCTLKPELYFIPVEDPLENSSQDEAQPKLRKSMSVGNLVLFNEQTKDPEQFSTVPELCEKVKAVNMKEEKDTFSKKTSSTRASASKLHRPMSRANLDRLALPKRYNSVENLHSKEKFISLAESVIQFQNKTPKRFRSRPDLVPPPQKQPLQITVPHSPALQTKILAKSRFRESRLPSYEERLQMEFDKEQKFKIKANPVNKRILNGPLKPTVPVKKPATIPEPFHLTELAPKKPQTPPKKFEFHAQPMPNYTLQPKKVEEKKFTEAVTPSFMKHYKKEMVQKHQNEESSCNNKPADKPLQTTKPRPFSFERRDKQIQIKKEQLVQKYIKEEKRAREFHAKPVPKYIRKSNASSRNASSCGSIESKSQENLLQNFRAKPPTVLYKEPFIPQRSEKPCTAIEPFPLNTEYRAQEREEFEKERKEREVRLELMKKMAELQLIQKEQEEVSKLRKQAEVKAQPIRKYKELHIVPSQKVTMPISPKFETDRIRKRDNKENLSNNVAG